MTVNKQRIGTNNSSHLRGGPRATKLEAMRNKKNAVERTVREVKLAETVPGFLFYSILFVVIRSRAQSVYVTAKF